MPCYDAAVPATGQRTIQRREFLAGALALGLPAPLMRRAARPPTPPDPFTLGVASGYPLPTGVVLWTRLAPTPLVPGGGMPRTPVTVTWEIAGDESMSRIVQRGSATAVPEWAHAVHVEVEGLEPGRWYWYRFRTGRAVSPIGRTRTAPAASTMPDRLRFAFASCQHWEQGYFVAHRHIVADDLDLVVFLGDYIYESPTSATRVRQHGAPEPHTLDDYRIRHALYKTDPDLRAAHAAYPWIVTWDDHEVSNDYANDRGAMLNGREWFLARRAAAYQAYYEHLPLRRQMVPFGPHMRIYHRTAYGGLVQFHLLDNRQYRAHQPCTPPGRGGGGVAEDCAERLDPALSMLGVDQERWLEAGLDRSRARWNVIAQQSLIAQRDLKPGPGQQFFTDRWDGYPAARRRLLDYVGQRKPANPVVIGGDLHAFYVSDLKPDFDDARSPVVATEFVGTSITSRSALSEEALQALLPDNPHVTLVHGARRGYVRVELTPGRLRADLQVMHNVTDRRAAAETYASFVVEDGRPGASRA
jgi:alkaline phosphatase D